jgi:V/A-type H+-transporting ATPase subunit K
MDIKELSGLGYVLALTLSAMGSVAGTTLCGMAAVGAWKKCYVGNRAAPFILVALVGAPLAQTIYGMILMNAIKNAPETVSAVLRFSTGLMGGLTIGLSAWFVGRVAAFAADALAETGKGFGNYIMVIGVIESVGLFVMVFLMTVLR